MFLYFIAAAALFSTTYAFPSLPIGPSLENIGTDEGFDIDIGRDLTLQNRIERFEKFQSIILSLSQEADALLGEILREVEKKKVHVQDKSSRVTENTTPVADSEIFSALAKLRAAAAPMKEQDSGSENKRQHWSFDFGPAGK